MPFTEIVGAAAGLASGLFVVSAMAFRVCSVPSKLMGSLLHRATGYDYPQKETLPGNLTGVRLVLWRLRLGSGIAAGLLIVLTLALL